MDVIDGIDPNVMRLKFSTENHHATYALDKLLSNDVQSNLLTLSHDPQLFALLFYIIIKLPTPWI